MSNPYFERPICIGCGKIIPYGQKYLHAACVNMDEKDIGDLTIQTLYELYQEDPEQSDTPLLGIYTSFGLADIAATGKGISGLKAFIRPVKGLVYNHKAYVLKHVIVTPVDTIIADIEKQKKVEALSKLSPEEKTILGLDSTVS